MSPSVPVGGGADDPAWPVVGALVVVGTDPVCLVVGRLMAAVLVVWCRARTHGPAARQAGCVCPERWGVPYRPARRRPRREYVPGRRINHRGASRLTVTEPDEAAVERRISGDLRVVLTKAERDAAIDWLDRYGLSAKQIGIRLGLAQRTVQRRRAARRALERAADALLDDIIHEAGR